MLNKNKELKDALQIEELSQEVEVQIPQSLEKAMENMDFADRMEYLWNLEQE